MSDLAITAANVVQLSGQAQQANAAVAITAGQAIYLDPTLRTWQLALSNSMTPATQKATAVAVNSAAVGQPVSGATSGTLSIGATVVPGEPYVLSGANAGGIAPVTDLTTGMFTEVVCYGLTTTTVTLAFSASGVAHA